MKVLHGIPAAPGLAIGPAHIIRPAPPVDVTAPSKTPSPRVPRNRQLRTRAVVSASANRVRFSHSGESFWRTQ